MKRKNEDPNEHVRKPAKVRRLGQPPIYKVPPEIMGEIAGHLLTEELTESFEAIRTFALTSRYFRNTSMGAPTPEGRFEGGAPSLRRLHKRVRSLAVQTFLDTVPEREWPDLGSGGLPRSERRDEPVAPDDIVAAVGPLLPFQTNAARAKLVESINDLDSEAAAVTQKVLARFSDGLDSNSFSDLGHDAIAILKAPGELNNDDRINAAEAIALLKKHGQLTRDHRTEIDDAIAARPELNGLLENREQALEQEGAADALVQISQADSRGVERSALSLDHQINFLEEQLRDAAVALVYTEHGRLDVREEVARDVLKLKNPARAKLAASVRDDRSL